LRSFRQGSTAQAERSLRFESNAIESGQKFRSTGVREASPKKKPKAIEGFPRGEIGMALAVSVSEICLMETTFDRYFSALNVPRQILNFEFPIEVLGQDGDSSLSDSTFRFHQGRVVLLSTQ
jgi:hypothetical protein